MEYPDYQNWIARWCVAPSVFPKSPSPYVDDYTDRAGMRQNNGLDLSEYILEDFESGEDNFDPFVVPTQDSDQIQEISSSERLRAWENLQSHSLPTDTALHDYDLLDGFDESEYENTLALALHDYDLLDPSTLSTASSTASLAVDNFDFCNEFNTNFPISLSDIDSLTFDNYPHDYGSPSSLESTDTSHQAVTASETLGSDSIPVSTDPTYEDNLESPHDDVDNATPSNTSFPHDISSQSTSNDGHCSEDWSEALRIFFALFDGEPTVDGTSQEKALDSRAGEDASPVTIVPAENKNMDDFNAQWTSNESTWAVNSFNKEGIETLTFYFERDTEAGPSTGSSVAAAMLDIEQARHGQSRDDWATSESAPPEKQKGKGKRKAEDAPEPPPPSKKLRIDPPAQTMGNIIFTQPAPESTLCPEGVDQKNIWKFVHMLGPGKASGDEGPSSLSGQESAYMTFKHDENGELHARDMVSARDSHVRRLQKDSFKEKRLR